MVHLSYILEKLNACKTEWLIRHWTSIIMHGWRSDHMTNILMAVQHRKNRGDHKNMLREDRRKPGTNCNDHLWKNNWRTMIYMWGCCQWLQDDQESDGSISGWIMNRWPILTWPDIINVLAINYTNNSKWTNGCHSTNPVTCMFERALQI